MKSIGSHSVSALGIAATALFGVMATIAPAYAIETVPSVASQQNKPADFWFTSEEGIRTFDIEENVLVPHLLAGDQIKIEGNIINAYNAQGKLVASIKSDLPEGIVLKYTDGVIYAGSESGDAARCIDNKWVSLGINIAADALVCAPLGAATGGVGGFACGAAVGTGITTASC